jgi:cytochrome c553
MMSRLVKQMLQVSRSIVAVGASMLLVQSAVAAGAPIVGDPVKAKSKIAMCIGCHGIPGYRTAYPAVYSVPMIAGQNAKYIENALQAYKKGERGHPSMQGIAKSLSDQDMADLAAYYALAK